MNGSSPTDTDLAARNTDPAGKNRRTAESYERIARDYAESVEQAPSASSEKALRDFAAAAGPGGTALEIGSGPGWDADFIETLGLKVDRTDVAQAFLDLQSERGKRARMLDIVRDDPCGPYDGIMALHVLQHIDRVLMDAVLGKIADALRPGGVFLAALREGDGEYWEKGQDSGGDYHVVLWTAADFSARLEAAGLYVDWMMHATGRDGDWMTVLARKA